MGVTVTFCWVFQEIAVVVLGGAICSSIQCGICFTLHDMLRRSIVKAWLKAI